ncbi:MAG: glycosyltransferase [Chloroflexi bacterium]|nr:glycosyltransferase [Chloroflexota bacterium]
MKASIIVPTSNRKDELSKTLESLAQHVGASSAIEIVVVDNQPSSDTQAIVTDANKKLSTSVRYVREFRPGLHHARHAGATAARGAVLIFIDDDVDVSENWLSAHLKAYEEPGVSAAGGRILPMWESAPPKWIEVVPREYFGLLDYGNKSRLIQGSEGINGGNYSILREALFGAGGFHPDSFPDPSMIWLRGDGEAGLTRKLQSRQERVMYLADADVHHRIPDGRMSIASLSRRAFAHGIENGYTFARKRHCRAWSLVALYLIGLAATAAIAPAFSFRSRSPENIARSELARTRYRAMRSYATRLARNGDLRMHVMMNTYLEEFATEANKVRTY